LNGRSEINKVMKQYKYIEYNRSFRFVSDAAQRWLLIAFIVLLTTLSSIPANAQFIKINLEIPTKMGQTEIEPINFSIQSDINTGLETLEGSSVLCISGVENLQIQAALNFSSFLSNEMGDELKFYATLAFRNDGISKAPGIDTGCLASFPLSNSGRIIENIKGNPVVLNAYIFIHATAELPKLTKYTYVGDINLKIEYN
jgi:hypothetical protein